MGSCGCVDAFTSNVHAGGGGGVHHAWGLVLMSTLHAFTAICCTLCIHYTVQDELRDFFEELMTTTGAAVGKGPCITAVKVREQDCAVI